MRKLGFMFIVCGVLMLNACTQWPAIYVGDSSGILSYDRVNHKLELIWENHSKLKGQQADTLKSDIQSSIQVNE